MTGGHCDNNLLPHIYQASAAGVANGADAIRAKVCSNMKYGADVIKFTATGGVLSRNTDVNASQYSLAEMQALVAEAHDRGAIVAAHAHGAEGIKLAIRSGVRGIEHASLIDDEGIALAKARGTYLVMDVYNGDYIAEVGRRDGWSADILRKNDETTDAQRQGFARAVKAGVKLPFGTDAGVFPHGLQARQFAYMVRFGMTPLQAIRSATTVAAEFLGWDKDVGSLTPGHYADMIALRKNPLADVTELERVVHVIKGGVVVR